MARVMKDSGIEWIGKIPKEWEINRLKNILLERKENNNPVKTKNILSLTNDKGVIPYSEKGNMGNKAKEDLTGYKLAYPNDIVLNSMNIIIGSVGLSKYYGCVSPVYYMLYSNDKNIKYYNYIFQTKVFQNSLKGLGNGILEIRMRIPMEKLNNVILPIPSLEEQEKIANYLDKKIADIDLIIEKTKVTIEDYKKYKQSIITEAVTKGLNPNVEMKDSGIEWIEKVPNHWEVSKIKNYFSFGKGLGITKENLESEGISVINYGQIHSKENKGTEIVDSLIRYVNEKYLKTDPNSLVKQGDFIFADTSEDFEGSGNNIYINTFDILFAGYHTIILKANNQKNNKYLAYLFFTDNWRSQIRSRVTGIKLFSITQKILKQTTLILPPLEEQQQIVDYLDKKVAEIDNLISKKERLISEMEEYKKSLIYECVTGKKEVIEGEI